MQLKDARLVFAAVAATVVAVVVAGIWCELPLLPPFHLAAAPVCLDCAQSGLSHHFFSLSPSAALHSPLPPPVALVHRSLHPTSGRSKAHRALSPRARSVRLIHQLPFFQPHSTRMNYCTHSWPLWPSERRNIIVYEILHSFYY